jgi:DNA (cytosine-5)-methyltransferase 1
MVLVRWWGMTETKKKRGLNELALFAGAGGGILGGLLHGWRTVAAVEIEDYPRRVLLQRQADGILPRFPIWDDVCTFDGKPWRGKVDVISGGFPCQDISAAGKGAGIEGERSGLWKEMARIISEVRSPFVFVENSPLLISRGLTTVLSDLSKMGYDAQWCIVSASDCGAPHKRDRVWIVANADSTQRKRGSLPSGIHKKHANTCRSSWWEAEPELGRVAHGVAHRVDRLKAIGNGQVPIVAATAWEILNND